MITSMSTIAWLAVAILTYVYHHATVPYSISQRISLIFTMAFTSFEHLRVSTIIVYQHVRQSAAAP